MTELLSLNSGVDVVINVDTSNYSGSKLQIRNINNEQFKTGSNVVWNFRRIMQVSFRLLPEESLWLRLLTFPLIPVTLTARVICDNFYSAG